MPKNNDAGPDWGSPSTEQEIFDGALAKKDGSERSAYLNDACRGNNALRARIDELLRNHQTSDPFMASSALEASTVLLKNQPSEGVGGKIGRYKLLQQIGEGGMGAVYMAEQNEPVVRKVALKIIKMGMDTKAVVARFEAERQALAMMDHPNIAKVLDGGATDTGRPYFVMELVRGVPITEFCDKNRLSPAQRLELFIPVCQAIQHAHQKGIIHRDIKPSNVLVTTHDGKPVPMVIDFGIAKATSQRLTERTLFTNFGEMIGTPAYMSPEQAEMSKLDVDTRTDVYSLGVLLYELLTGTPPFTNKELLDAGYAEMQRMIMEQEPPRPSTRLSTMQEATRTSVARNRSSQSPALTRLFKGDLDWIVMKCLEKERGRRYETASALAADLGRHLANEAIHARPPSTWYRLQKAANRNRLAVVSVSAVVIALFLGTTLSLWQAWVATQAKSAERTHRLAAQAERDNARSAQKQAQRAEAAERIQREESEHRFYAASMLLAHQAWEDCNLSLLQKVLSETAKSPYRGFEWFYWRKQMHGFSKCIIPPSPNIRCLSFSPDSETLLTAAIDGQVTLWQLQEEKPIRTFSCGDRWLDFAYYTSASNRIVTADSSGAIKTWDPDTGKQMLQWTDLGKPQVSSAGAHSSFLSFDYKSSTLQIHNALDGSLQHILPSTNFTPSLRYYNPPAIAFSGYNRRICIPTFDTNTGFWTPIEFDLTTGKPVYVLPPSGDVITAMSYSREGSQIAVAYANHTAQVWNHGSNSPIATLVGHKNEITALAFTPDSSKVVTTSTDQSVRIWNSTTGAELALMKGHSGPIHSIAISPNGRWIASVGAAEAGDRVLIWDLQTLPAKPKVAHHPRWVVPILISPDARSFITRPQLTPEETKDLLPGFKVIATSEQARLCSTDTGRLLMNIAIPLHQISAYAFSFDGKCVLTGTENGRVTLWNALSGNEECSRNFGTNEITCLAVSRDSCMIAVGSTAGVIRIWSTNSGSDILQFSRDTGFDARAISFSPNGHQLAAGSSDGQIRLWAIPSGTEVFSIQAHRAPICSISFSPNNSSLLVGSDDKTATIVSANDGMEMTRLVGHNAEITAAKFSPDACRILTTSWDQTARLWDASTGRELLSIKGSAPYICDGAFSADGQNIILIGEDQIPQVVTAASSYEVTQWEKQESELWKKEVLKNRAVMIRSFKNYAFYSIQRGLWRNAETKLIQIRDFLPATDWTWLHLAAIFAHRSSTNNFSEHVKAILRQSADTDDPSVAERAAKAALLLPTTDRVILEWANEAADKALRLGSNHGWLTYFQAVKGLAEFRLGHFQASTNWLELALKRRGDIKELDAFVFAVLAMARHHLGEVHDARRALAAAKVLIKTRMPGLDSGNLGDGWWDVLNANILVREAERVLGAPLTEEEERTESTALAELERKSQANQRANVHAGSERWKEAIDELHTAIEWRPADLFMRYQLGSIFFHLGDRATFELLVKESLDRAVSVKDVRSLSCIAEMSWLMPPPAHLKTAATTFVDQVLSMVPPAQDNELAWARFAKGLAEYRLGRFSQSLDWLVKSLQHTSEDTALDAHVHCSMAMACAQLGQDKEAQAALEKATAIVRTKMPQLGTQSLGDSWHDVLKANALLREAQSVVLESARSKR